MFTFLTNKTFRFCAGRKLVPAKSWPEVLVASATRLIVYPNLMALDATVISGAYFIGRGGLDIELLLLGDATTIPLAIMESSLILCGMYASIYPAVFLWCVHSWSRDRLRILSAKETINAESKPTESKQTIPKE